MLCREPEGITKKALACWKNIGALKLDELTLEPNMDDGVTEYREWTDKQGNKWFGQVQPGSKRQHGIVREVTLGGWVQER